MQSVTFVLVGRRRGATADVGQNGRYRFVNGEFSAPSVDAGLLSVALAHYGAYPKGDAEKHHLKACAKLGIDPETLKPLGEVVARPEPVAEPAPTPDPDPEPVEDALHNEVLNVLSTVSNTNPECWTKEGTVSVHWVNQRLPEGMEASRKLIDEFNVHRSE